MTETTFSKVKSHGLNEQQTTFTSQANRSTQTDDLAITIWYNQAEHGVETV